MPRWLFEETSNLQVDNQNIEVYHANGGFENDQAMTDDDAKWSGSSTHCSWQDGAGRNKDQQINKYG